MFYKKTLEKYTILALSDKPQVIEWKALLYRGLKNISIKEFKPDHSGFDGPKYYGKGVYYHPTTWLAAQWIGDTGIIVAYKPTRSLRLLEHKKSVDRIDHLKGLPKDVDGVYLASSYQEAGQQIILKDPSLVKASSYWDYVYADNNLDAGKQLDPKKRKRIR